MNIDTLDIDKSGQIMKDTKMCKSNISKSFQKSFLSFCDEVSTSKESNNENQSDQIFNVDIEPKEDDNSIGGQPDSKVRKLEKIIRQSFAVFTARYVSCVSLSEIQ